MSTGGKEEGTGSAVRGSDKLLMQLKPFCETLHSWCYYSCLLGFRLHMYNALYFTPLKAAGSPGPQITA